jgi:UDP-N-acetylglucosamine--N-acetylmuramyl-(pentapeptide) pyrophosphoryl-undecaprenol N-acetylglucosamine transferase
MKKTQSSPIRLLFVGGGSGGPTSPLLAVIDQIQKNNPGTEFLFIGGRTGPEKHMASSAGVPFKQIVSGKFRRYLSFKNFLTPFLILVGFVQSLFILNAFQPQAVMGAGSYIQVPLLWAAWILRIPILIHQQDVQPTLANVLCSALASRITVSFEDSVKSFSSSSGLFHKSGTFKACFTGNPVRSDLIGISKMEALKVFNLRPDKPILLVLGGGTGATAINELIWQSLYNLTQAAQIIHAVGKGKNKKISAQDYHPFEFIDRMDAALAAADVVVSRAGLSTITELSYLGKISIIIPMPNSHQEDNAAILKQREAAIIADQASLTSEQFTSLVRNLLINRETQHKLTQHISGLMPHDATRKVSGELLALASIT